MVGKDPNQEGSGGSDVSAQPAGIQDELKIKPKLLHKRQEFELDQEYFEYEMASEPPGQKSSFSEEDSVKLCESLAQTTIEGRSPRKKNSCKSSTNIQKIVEVADDQNLPTYEVNRYSADVDSAQMITDLRKIYDQHDKKFEEYAEQLARLFRESGKKDASQARKFYSGQVKELEEYTEKLSKDLLDYGKKSADKARSFNNKQVKDLEARADQMSKDLLNYSKNNTREALNLSLAQVSKNLERRNQGSV